MKWSQPKIPWISAAVLVALCGSTLSSGQDLGQDRIRAIRGRDGRLVLTNLATYTRETVAPVPAERQNENLDSMVARISAEHGVDPALTRSVIEVESNFDTHAVSPKGARGLMQLMPATGERFGVRDFFDPAENIEGGVLYLSFLLDKFNGALDLTLAAYNAGENLVARLGRVPAIPETQRYVQKVRSALAGRLAKGLAPLAPETAGNGTIYRTVDARGGVRFSNVGP